MPRADQKLTNQDIIFVESMIETNNKTESARRAKLSPNKNSHAQLGNVMANKPRIKKEIARRRELMRLESEKKTLSLNDFWTDAVQNPSLSMVERLKASELLGRAQGLFVEKKKIDHEIRVIVCRGNDSIAAMNGRRIVDSTAVVDDD